jgi:LPS-assembly protein
MRSFPSVAFIALALAASTSAFAQPPQPPRPAAPPPAAAAPAPQQETQIRSDTTVRRGDDLEIRKGHFEYEQGDTKIYADNADYYPKQRRLVLQGNVVLAQGANRISADRADFNVDTRIGTFYHAYGIGTLKPPKPQAARPGAPPGAPVSNQPTDVYFFGDTIEKVGPRKYRITNGGFSPCVQPTPRWQLNSGTVILNLDHYTILKNAILTVKGVPMLYLPVMYYPTKKEDRATGFLLPTYGSSSLRGQQIHNAFFWAIDRSQDATFEHEWYSIGQGASGEYRYNFGGGNSGNLAAHFLDQKATTYTLDDGSTTSLDATRSYDFRGGLNQSLPGGFRARANVAYFSNLVTNQTYNTNVLDASTNTRNYGGNVAGAIGGYTINATVNHSEYFYDANNSGITGAGPQVDIARTERPLFGSQLYFAVNGEYARLLYETKGIDNSTGTPVPFDVNQDLTRLDVTPQIRYPFKQWQWFTVNSTFSWRDTYYTRSQDPNAAVPLTNPNGVVDVGLNRRFFTAQTQITGPVFNRIWDTPENGYAEKFKHSIEPYVTIARTSSIDNYANIVKIDGTDSIFGGTTSFVYGVTNRFFAKRKTTPGRPAVSSEIIDVQIEQTYYTQAAASLVDPRYASSFTSAVTDTSALSNFSPIALTVRAIPTAAVNASIRAEFDSRYHSLRTINATGSYSVNPYLTASVQWSKKAFIAQLPGFNDPNLLDHSIGSTSNVHTRDNQYGVAYQFNYDVLHSAMVQQQVSGYYNAQCCGLAFQYQTYNFGQFSSVPSDHRFFISFTLAGLGNFSPFNGAMSGVPR